VTIIPIIRKFLAALSAFGLGASVLIYVRSFFGATMENGYLWLTVLAIPAAALFPTLLLEHSMLEDRTWKGFVRDMPAWVVPCICLLMLFSFGNFLWDAFLRQAGAPIVKDGQYLLVDRGQILKEISQAEYLALREADLRGRASLMIAWFFIPMARLWFPRTRRQTNNGLLEEIGAQR